MANSTSVYFGVARRCITPSVPVALCGYFYLRMSDRVRDDIFVSVVALADGNSSTAIVGFDWAVMPAPVVERLRHAVSDMPKLDPLHILCTCTHSHNSPETRQDEPGYNDEYTQWAIDQAAAAIREAFAGLRKVDRLLVGQAHVAGVSFNRRYWMKSGRVVTNPPRGSEEIVKPEGVIDPEIPLLGIECAGRLAVLLASIVNHTDTLGSAEISADWPGVVRRELESKYGAGLLVMPLIGTSGNVNHIDATRPGEIYVDSNPERIGRAYVSGIEMQLGNLEPVPAESLAVVRRTFTLSPREIDSAELLQAKSDSEQFSRNDHEKLTSEGLATGAPAARKYFADALLRVAADRREKQYDVTAIRMGEVVFLSMPGEPFVEIGLTIRNDLLRGRHALLISHGNAAPNYFPLPENFANGGYETTPLCAPHGTDSAIRMLAAVRESILALGLENREGNIARLPASV